MDVKKAVVVSLETFDKAMAFLGKCPYQEVAGFLGQLVAEASATLHDLEEVKKTVEEVVSLVEEVKED